MTVGPWRNISVEHYNVRITDFYTKVTVGEDLAARLDVLFSLSEDSVYNASITLETFDRSSILSSQTLQIAGSTGETHISFKSGEIDLWYPVGYGKQTRYVVTMQIMDSVSPLVFYILIILKIIPFQHNNVFDSKEQTIGIRRVKVVQDELIDQEGRTFLFEVNNIRIFCGGMVIIKLNTL